MNCTCCNFFYRQIISLRVVKLILKFFCCFLNLTWQFLFFFFSDSVIEISKNYTLFGKYFALSKKDKKEIIYVYILKNVDLYYKNNNFNNYEIFQRLI